MLKVMTEDETSRPTCFIAMPVAMRAEHYKRYEDTDHWTHVREALFEKAVREAGFDPIPPVAEGSALIHSRIVEQLSTADMVLCDMSAVNPNVFFELGIRTALNKPVALVHDITSPPPFDVSGLNALTYDPGLRMWNADREISNLAKHLKTAAEQSKGANPLWEKFGLEFSARRPESSSSPTDARLALIESTLREIANSVSYSPRGQADTDGTLADRWGPSPTRLARLSEAIGNIYGGEIPDSSKIGNTYRFEFINETPPITEREDLLQEVRKAGARFGLELIQWGTLDARGGRRANLVFAPVYF